MSAIWKLQDAKARFSELVREARNGDPQCVSVHGKVAVVMVDPERFVISPRRKHEKTFADFIEQSKKYRAKTPEDDVEFDTRFEIGIGLRPSPFSDVGDEKG